MNPRSGQVWNQRISLCSIRWGFVVLDFYFGNYYNVHCFNFDLVKKNSVLLDVACSLWYWHAFAALYTLLPLVSFQLFLSSLQVFPNLFVCFYHLKMSPISHLRIITEQPYENTVNFFLLYIVKESEGDMKETCKQ